MNPISLVLNILWAAFVFWLGWKAHAYFERRPRWLKWGKKKDAAEPGAEAKSSTKNGAGGIVDRIGRTGERIGGKIVEKGLETFLGKPKKPKDDKEDE